jgi:hypothetical protein
MASYHSVQIRSGDAGAARELLDGDPALSMFEYLLSLPRNGWVTVLPKRIDKGRKTAKTLSLKLHTDGFFFRTYGSEAFLYSYFRNGEGHDEYCSRPDAVRDLQEMDDEMAAIVGEWEQGGISAAEYRERMDGYLSRFDDRVARVRAEARSVNGSEREVAAAVGRLVTEEFRGREAEKIVREILTERFPGRDVAALVRASRPPAASTGGTPRAFAHLLSDVAGVERLLASKGDAVDLLAGFAAFLRIEEAATSFQHAGAAPGYTPCGSSGPVV